MSYQSENAALSELQEAFSDSRRYLDLCLSIRRKTTDEEILTIGGRWDRTEEQFLADDPDDLAARVMAVNDNQTAAFAAYTAWLIARIQGLPRKRLLLTGGDRRGGKSWILTAMACTTAIAIPNAIVWLISPALNKREELEKYIKGHVPREWREYSARDMTFKFPNGSTIRNVTGDDADALKRGEADLVCYNEPQLMVEDVLTYGAPAIVDKGGLLLFAGNPARRRKGVWFTRIVKAVESGKYSKGSFCRLSAADNPDIDSSARGDIGELMTLVNPEAARADYDGIFMEPGSFAYAEHFDDTRNTCASLPDIVSGDITAQLIKRAGVYGGLSTLCGVDFQSWPFNAGVSLLGTGDASDPTWYVTGYLQREGEEDLFLDEAFALWDQSRTLWIGDASGTWQDAQHIRGRSSFDKFKARRWRIEPPQKKRSDRGDHPANPAREDRIDLVNGLLRRGKLIICMDKAAPVAEALAKCEVDAKGKPKGRYAHLSDALGYPLWWATPKPKAHSSAPAGSGVQSIARPQSKYRI